MADELSGWAPVAKVVFSDQELIRELRRTQGQPDQRSGNWFAFYSALPKPEQARLEAEARTPERQS
jgi:hypothetical protein